MSRDPLLYVEDIYEACEKVKRYSQGSDREEFFQDDMRVDAVIRNLEIIGEAVRYIPEFVRSAMPEVPWTQISGMRNVLAHAYFGIDPDIVWDVVTNKVEPLSKSVETYLARNQ
jgi:uncharacterized protein with HEPN domain